MDTQLGMAPASSGLQVSIILHIFSKNLMQMLYLLEILLTMPDQIQEPLAYDTILVF